MKDYINQNTPRMEKILATSSKTGLSSSAVTARRKKHGKNHILPSSGCVFARFLLFLAKNIPFYLMLSILIVSAFYLPLPTVITVGAVYFAFLVGVFLLFLYRERQNLLLWRAALPLVGVVRNGCVSYVSPEELVVGDLILLTEGSILYCEAHVVSEDDLEVFCEREGQKNVLIKHGGACFEEGCEAFNSLSRGDVVRSGDGCAFVTKIANKAPRANKKTFSVPRSQRALCRVSVYFSYAASLISIPLALLLFDSFVSALPVMLCAVALVAISPATWCDLFFEVAFLARNRRAEKRKGVLFSSVQAARDASQVNCFLLPTKSIFQSSYYRVRSFENGIGAVVSAKNSHSTFELSLISSALLRIRESYSMPSYEEHLLAFCKKHASLDMQLQLDGIAFSEEYDDLSAASFSSVTDGRGFSFVGGDPETLLPFVMYISEEGRTRFLDEKEKQHVFASVRRLKKNGYRLMAYAETQTRVSAGAFPRLVRDMKLLGFFVLGELPDTSITEALQKIERENKKAVFFHDGNDPSWIIESLPILQGVPILDGNDDRYLDEIRVFAQDETLPFCVLVHMTPSKQSQITHVLTSFGYTTMAYGSSFGDHRMMYASAVASTNMKSKNNKTCSLTHASADVYVAENIASQTACTEVARALLQSFGGLSAYLCSALFARSILLLFGALFGRLIFSPFLLAFFAAVLDLSAFWCLSRVRSDFGTNVGTEKMHEKHLGFFMGGVSGVVLIGALASVMAALPHVFGFSHTAFAIYSLLLLLNVGVLRFASLKRSWSVLLFPLLSVVVASGYYLAESLMERSFSFAADLPFWILLPTVVLLAIGEFVPKYILRNKNNIDNEEQRSMNDE